MYDEIENPNQHNSQYTTKSGHYYGNFKNLNSVMQNFKFSTDISVDIIMAVGSASIPAM